MIIEEISPQLAKKPPTNLVELCQEYKTSSWFTKLADITKKDYERLMVALLASPYGLKSIDTITPRMADVIYNQVKAQHGDAQGSKFVAVWHRIFEFADKYEYCQRNPWRKVQVDQPKARTQSWTEEEVFKFIDAALAQGKKPLAVAICIMYDTGQRPSDVLYLRYANVKKDDLGYYVDLIQSKRKAHVKPALSKYTIGLLGGEGAIAARDPDDLVVENYRNLGAMQHEYRVLRDELGFAPIQMRDLRRTAITEMGEASDDLMISVSGHTNRSMLNIYSLRNRQKALEAQRIRHATRNSRLNQEYTPSSGEEKTD